MDQQSVPPEQYKAYQNQIRRQYLYWYKTWDKDRKRKWELFVFCLSILRAMEVSWRDIGNAIGRSREGTRAMYWEKIFPLRDDVVEYARITRKDQVLKELADIHLDLMVYDTELFNQVQTMRQEGASWTTVGKALGITRQAAQQRFSQPGRASYRRVAALAQPHLRLVSRDA